MVGNASDDVRRMIVREKEIMEGLKRMRKSARNKTVKAQCDAQISEATRNIAYLEQSLANLNLNKTAPTQDSKITRLDLFRWDKPQNMGPRIQLMLQQLEYKLSIEQQYERGTRKMIQLYTKSGGRKVQAETHANLDESTAKITLLKRSKKRYSDMNLASVIGSMDEEADVNLTQPNVRRPLTGVLRVFVKQVEEVDHTIAWSDQVEMWVSMRVENNSAAVARTRPSTSSLMNEDFSIPVDKGNEIEFTVYDRAITPQATPTPVALLWLRISDITEAIRQKRVEREFEETGWASAAKVQALNETSGDDSGFDVSTGASSASGNAGAPGGSALTGPPITAQKRKPNLDSNSDLETVEGWFTLEPAGRIYLKLGFEKSGSHLRKRPRMYDGSTDLARLGRHNAIRKREETQQIHGHEFISQQAYNIVKCSVCGDFTTSYLQCQECQLTCDRKCSNKIVTKCVALMSQDPDEEINHSIPHHFEPTTNMKATWCAQCGFILPLASKKNVRKCTECSIMVHANCANFVPDLCGMSMTMAAQVVNEINSTRIRQASKAAAVNMQREKLGGHGYSSSMSSLKTMQSRVPPPKNTPVRRKQVPSQASIPSKEEIISKPSSKTEQGQEQGQMQTPDKPIGVPGPTPSVNETQQFEESYAPLNPVYVSPQLISKNPEQVSQTKSSASSASSVSPLERSPEQGDVGEPAGAAGFAFPNPKRESVSSKYPELEAFNTGQPIPVDYNQSSDIPPYMQMTPRKAPAVPNVSIVAGRPVMPTVPEDSDAISYPRIPEEPELVREMSPVAPLNVPKNTIMPVVETERKQVPEPVVKQDPQVPEPVSEPVSEPLVEQVPEQMPEKMPEPALEPVRPLAPAGNTSMPAVLKTQPTDTSVQPLEPVKSSELSTRASSMTKPKESTQESANVSEQTSPLQPQPQPQPQPQVQPQPQPQPQVQPSEVLTPQTSRPESPYQATPLQSQNTYDTSDHVEPVAEPVSGLHAGPYGGPYTGPYIDPYSSGQVEPIPGTIPGTVPEPIPEPSLGVLPSQQAPSAPAPRTVRKRRRNVGLDDFSFLAVLGKGNFGKVMLAESKRTHRLYAVKVLKKNFIIENREVESTRSEKRVFLIANRERHPFLVNLFACFQTENRIYFVMDYVSGGDLMFHIQQKMFTAKRAQFYAAEVLLALKHFHDNEVIYRDLKLDNILLSLDGHIKVADYGLCKENMGFGSTTGTFCGTPDFIAPEILLDQKYGRSVDWWALGVLMYQMLLGKSPFHGNDEDEVYDAILSDEPLYPIHMPRDSVSILQQLLTRDPSKRLGSGPDDALEIMNHPYFNNINFDDLLNLRVEPPYKPELESPTDVRYFEREFTSEMPALTPMNSVVTTDMQEEFRGFSYSLEGAI